MKNVGKIFEDDFAKSVSDNIYTLRLKDTAASFTKGALYSTTEPYDRLLFNGYSLCCFELKSVQQATVAFSNIRQCQIEGLTKADKYLNVTAGFIFNLRGTNHTYFVDIKDFLKFQKDTNKKSINEADIIKYNGMIINQKLKRTHYAYDIDGLLNR